MPKVGIAGKPGIAAMVPSESLNNEPERGRDCIVLRGGRRGLQLASPSMRRRLAATEVIPAMFAEQRLAGSLLLDAAFTEGHMGKGILLWLLGIPIPIIILILLFWH
jgi:hypothetical protein